MTSSSPHQGTLKERMLDLHDAEHDRLAPADAAERLGTTTETIRSYSRLLGIKWARARRGRRVTQ